MFNIPSVHEIVAEMSEELLDFRQGFTDEHSIAVHIQDKLIALVGAFPIRLLQDIPGEKRHGMTEGRQCWAWNDRHFNGDNKTWVMGDDGEPVCIRSREYEVVR